MNKFNLGRKFQLHYFTFIVAYVFFCTTVQNLAFWRAIYRVLSFDSLSTIFFALSLPVVLFCILNFFFSLILCKYLVKPLAILFLFLSALAQYFSWSYGTYINKEMLMNIVQTDIHEATALLTPKLFIWLFFLAVLPSLFIFRVQLVYTRPVWKSVLFRMASMLGSVIVMLVIILLLFKQYSFFGRNNSSLQQLITPVNYVKAVVYYVKQFAPVQNRPFVSIGQDAIRLVNHQKGQKPTLLVLVVGEASRAENFSLNGYSRDTNPLLSKQNNVINFKNATSCGTATAISVPCMFSNMERKEYSETTAMYQENVLDILARVGINILWRENDSGCKGVCDRVPTQHVADYIKNVSPPEGLYHDEYLLEGLDHYIKQQKKDTVIVLHTNGSHGPSYYQRYPEKFNQFLPSCQTSQVQDCSKTELINVYDNTIFHVDYVLNEVIELLKHHNNKFETAMVYMSDHGESLGEGGMYLHGMPYNIAPKQQFEIPMIFWFSDQFMQSRQINLHHMQQKAAQEVYSHDHLFHTMLGLMSVSTKEYKKQLDIFAPAESGKKH